MYTVGVITSQPRSWVLPVWQKRSPHASLGDPERSSNRIPWLGKLGFLHSCTYVPELLQCFKCQMRYPRPSEVSVARYTALRCVSKHIRKPKGTQQPNAPNVHKRHYTWNLACSARKEAALSDTGLLKNDQTLFLLPRAPISWDIHGCQCGSDRENQMVCQQVCHKRSLWHRHNPVWGWSVPHATV